MICNKCGKEITDDSKFCEYCGNSISNTEHISSPTITIQPIIITIVCVIICVVIFGTWSLIQKNNKNSTNSQSKVQYNNISVSSNENKNTTTTQETQPKLVSLFDTGAFEYISFDLDSTNYDINSPYFRGIKIFQIKLDTSGELLYTYTISSQNAKGRRS